MEFEVSLETTKMEFTPEFEKQDDEAEVGFGQIQIVTEYIGGEFYNGPYEVTPRVDKQIMYTKEKVMRDDVTIKEIPVFRVSNTSGGTTVYIAKEV